MHLNARVQRFLVFVSLLAITIGRAPLTGMSTTTLPYSARTKSYSGWSTTIRGDIRTLGMSGAMVGLADSPNASGDNPAGLAMTMQNTSIQVTGNRVRDDHTQEYAEVLTSNNVGIAASLYPWGLSMGYWIPQSEGQRYELPQSGELVFPEVYAQEFRVSAARLFLENRLSIGGSLIFGKAEKNLNFIDTPAMNASHTGYSLGGNVGVLYRFPQRWLVGLTYSTPMTYHTDSLDHPSPGIQNFFQPLLTPYRIGIGTSWIPNRFFRFGFSIYVVGQTTGVALLSDDAKLVGEQTTYQPRIGMSYLLAEFKELEIEASIGSYYEITRVQGEPNRPHVTAGVEFKPWIFNLGWGIDQASNYANFIYSGGIDVIKVMRKLELIPHEASRPPHARWMPRLAQISNEGLSRPLVDDWNEHRQNTNILEIGKELPKRLENKIRNSGKELQGIGGEVKYLSNEFQDIGGELIDVLQTVPEQIKSTIEKTKKKQEAETQGLPKTVPPEP